VTGKSEPAQRHLRIDHTHMGRRSTGIERITRELFSPSVLSPLPVETVTAGSGRLGVVMAQNTTLPREALRHSDDVFVFPGFPPSPYFSLARRDKTVLYVHDVFLLTRRAELNLAARLYFAPLFALAVRSLKHFLTNSEYTASTLRPFCRADASITLCRPAVRNVFGLTVGDRASRTDAPGSLTMCAMHLHIIGRPGWGPDAEWLAQQPYVKLLGPLPDRDARAAIEAADFLICTSRDEGLGLPLLEVQHGGVPVIAPDMPVFREVLGRSGLLVDAENAGAAAAAIATLHASEGWRARSTEAALANVARWNALAESDHAAVCGMFAQMLGLERPMRDIADAAPAHSRAA
jgi:hypothetical protein